LQIVRGCLYERLLFLGCFAFSGIPDFSDIAGLFDRKRCALGLSRVLVCGLGVFSGLAKSFGGSTKVVSVCFGSSGGSCPAWAAGLWPGSKVNAEMISFLRTGKLCLYLCGCGILSKRTYKFFSNAVDTGPGFD
jgi:hypothetical protein